MRLLILWVFVPSPSVPPPPHTHISSKSFLPQISSNFDAVCFVWQCHPWTIQAFTDCRNSDEWRRQTWATYCQGLVTMDARSPALNCWQTIGSLIILNRPCSAEPEDPIRIDLIVIYKKPSSWQIYFLFVLFWLLDAPNPGALQLP